jgi:hypothetical protein
VTPRTFSLIVAMLLLAACASGATVTAAPSTATTASSGGDFSSASTAIPSTTNSPRPGGSRTLDLGEILVGSDGLTEPIEIVVPPNTRSLAVTATGETGDIIAMASIAAADGADLVGLSDMPDLRRYLEETIGSRHMRDMPSRLRQEAGVGAYSVVITDPSVVTSTLVYLRLATTGESLDVRLELPEMDGAKTLPLDVFVVNGATEPLQPSARVLAQAASILRQAGIEVAWRVAEPLELEFGPVNADDVPSLDGPVSQLVAAAAPFGSDALDVFLVGDLGTGISGLAPGSPGPLLPHPLGGVIVRWHLQSSDTAKTIAHEVAHYLGVPHIEDVRDDGTVLKDPFGDTSTGRGNLMEDGTTITTQQSETMLGSPLLRP